MWPRLLATSIAWWAQCHVGQTCWLTPTSVRWSQHRIATRRHRHNETTVAWWPHRIVPCWRRLIPTSVAKWPYRTVSWRPRLIQRSVTW